MRYEVAVSVEKAKMVWANGSWPAGAYTDIRIFSSGLKKIVNEDEVAIGDSGHTDTRCVRPPGLQHPHHRTLATIRARQENVNKGLKQLFFLKHPFRHRLSLHGDFFFSVLNVTHPMLEDEPLFYIDF